MTADPLKPSAALLCKLGSLVVHLEEYSFGNSSQFDLDAIGTIKADPEVIEWFQQMNKLAMLPVPRTSPKTRKRK